MVQASSSVTAHSLRNPSSRDRPRRSASVPSARRSSVLSQVLAPTSRDGKLIDGIQVTIGPYGAGPYAEGSYDIKLPVDAAIYKAIKTEYQDAFARP